MSTAQEPAPGRVTEVMITCPNTDEEVGTSFATDAESYVTMFLDNVTLGDCPACGDTHTWSKADSFLAPE